MDKIAIDKYARKHPTSQQQNYHSEVTNYSRKVGSTSVAETTSNIIAYTKTRANITQSQCTHNEQQRSAQCKMIKMQRLLTEDTPADNNNKYWYNDSKYSKRAIYKPVGNMGTHTATDILKRYYNTRQLFVVTQSRQIRCPMKKVRQHRKE